MRKETLFLKLVIIALALAVLVDSLFAVSKLHLNITIIIAIGSLVVPLE